MFTEPFHSPDAGLGWVEVITGSMFSGKTEELMRRLNRARIARRRVEIFKPGIDTRYHQTDVVSHSQRRIGSTPVPSAAHLRLLAQGIDVVAIDEAQFFDGELVDVCRDLANAGQRVIVAGLDMDYRGQPFGPIPAIMATAEFVTKVHAICVRCGRPAHYSYRLATPQTTVLLGSTAEYEPRCRHCFLLGTELSEPLSPVNFQEDQPDAPTPDAPHPLNAPQHRQA